MLAIVSDEAQAQALRIKAAEALGWYTHSWQRQYIYDRLKRIDSADEAVADEVRRSLRRLEDNAHTR